MLRRALLPAALAAAALGGAGCGGSEPPAARPLEVAATTTQVADLAGHVGGARVTVRPLLAPNAGPHEFEPRPGTARAVAAARLVLRSGGDVDRWLGGVLAAAGGYRPVVSLIDAADAGLPPPPAGAPPDPHWWQDPRRAERAVVAIRDALVRADPAGRAAYAANARAYLARLRRLDRGIAACLATVPPGERELVTAHEALGAFARRYGIRIVGAVLPAQSTEAEPSLGAVVRLATQIRRERVRTVFPERALNPKLERAVAREAGVGLGRPLWVDTLGPPGSPAATYLGSMAENTAAMVLGFTGGRRSCRPTYAGSPSSL